MIKKHMNQKQTLISECINEFSPEKECPFYDTYHKVSEEYFNTLKISDISGEFKHDNNTKKAQERLIGDKVVITEQAMRLRGDFSVVKGDSLTAIVESLGNLKAELTEKEEAIFRGKANGTVSLPSRAAIVMRIAVLEAIRQGSTFVKEFTLPMLKVIGVAAIGALVGGTSGGILGAAATAGVGAVPAAITAAFLGAMPGLILKGLPLAVKAFKRFIKEIQRDDNLLKGYPIGLAVLSPPLLGVVVGPLFIKLIVDYMKYRVKTGVPPPKTIKAGATEVALMVSKKRPTRQLLMMGDGKMKISSSIHESHADYLDDYCSIKRFLKYNSAIFYAKETQSSYHKLIDIIMKIGNIEMNATFFVEKSIYDCIKLKKRKWSGEVWCDIKINQKKYALCNDSKRNIYYPNEDLTIMKRMGTVYLNTKSINLFDNNSSRMPFGLILNNDLKISNPTVLFMMGFYYINKNKHDR